MCSVPLKCINHLVAYTPLVFKSFVPSASDTEKSTNTEIPALGMTDVWLQAAPWWSGIKLYSLSFYLSCSPDAVYVLCAEPALCSQEIQDHLALFNDLQNTHTQM